MADTALNRDAYNRIAPDWDAARCAFHGRERAYLDAFLDGLPAGSSILDLGCGTGRPMAAYVLEQGHHITGVDQATALLARAADRLPAGTWIESTIEDFTRTHAHTSPDRFAGIICWDALFHIPRERHPQLLQHMKDMLHDNGRLMLTVGGSDHPAFTDTMFGETFFYDSLPPEAVVALLENLGFELVIAEFMNLPTNGRDKGRFAVVAQLP